MPSSSVKLIEPVITEIIKLRPASILEFGIGFGKWGFLIREYLDVCNKFLSKNEWQTKIVGVEICNKYINDLQRLIYNEIIVADIENLQIDYSKFDLFLMVDVLEHLHKDVGERIIKDVVSQTKTSIISVPIGEKWLMANKLWIDINEHEAHISSWDIKDFIDYPNLLKTIYVKDILGDIGIFIFHKK